MLAYKFRVENGVYGDLDSGAPAHHAFATLKRLEHLFETVAVHVPRRPSARRPCPLGDARRRRRRRGGGGLTFGATVCRVAVATAPAWCDDSSPTVRAVVRYLGGLEAAAQFDARRQPDSAVERRVLATVPYVRSLQLVDDRFVLTQPATVLGRELSRRITAVDERLTAGDGLAASLRHPTAVTDAYRSGMCLFIICPSRALRRRKALKHQKNQNNRSVIMAAYRGLRLSTAYPTYSLFREQTLNTAIGVS